MFRWATILMRFGSWDLIDMFTCVRVGVDDQLYRGERRLLAAGGDCSHEVLYLMHVQGGQTKASSGGRIYLLRLGCGRAMFHGRSGEVFCLDCALRAFWDILCSTSLATMRLFCGLFDIPLDIIVQNGISRCTCMSGTAVW